MNIGINHIMHACHQTNYKYYYIKKKTIFEFFKVYDKNHVAPQFKH